MKMYGESLEIMRHVKGTDRNRSHRNSIELRPHHLLCIQFFRGEGYSTEFVRAMTEIIYMLEKNDPIITLTTSCDIICRECPHNHSGECDSSDKVSTFDSRCLRECDLNTDDRMHYSELKALFYENIVSNGRLSSVCGNCCWIDICMSQSVTDRPVNPY